MNQDKKSIIDHQACSYLTFNTVDWVDIFIRPTYKQIISDTLNYYINTRGLIVYAWCLMTNHLHLLARNNEKGGLALIERDFKKITASKILEAIDIEPELRRHWMLSRFEESSQNLKKLEKYQLWQSCSNPSFIDFKEPFRLKEKVLHIHENPVRDRIVEKPEEYLFSSARDYTGKKGLVKVTVIDFEELLRAIIKA